MKVFASEPCGEGHTIGTIPRMKTPKKSADSPSAELTKMPKEPSVQMRIPRSVAHDLSIIAATKDMDANDYLTQIALAAIKDQLMAAKAVIEARIAARGRSSATTND